VTLVDARGLRCPIPVLRLARLAKDAPEGAELELWATDPAAEPDVRAWARMRGHEVVGVRPLEEEDPANDDDVDPRAAVVIKVRVSRTS